jgi:hypothetical protein
MKRLMLLTLSAVLVASPAVAKHHKAAAKPATAAAAPAELKWGPAPPALPGGAQLAVVKGDPMKKGPFTIHLKMPASYAVPPHWHPTDEKVTLVSGKLVYGMSDQLNRMTGTPLAEGASVTMKAKEHHWVMTADGAEVEVSAMGPFMITYVNPKDDPRPKEAPAAK